MQHHLADLLKQREGAKLDFKQKITNCQKIAKTICSFANTQGGIILIGVKDDRSIVGIDPEEEKYMLEQASLHYCQPPVPLSFEEFEDEEEVTVLMVRIEESPLKPHASLNKAGKWQVYLRQGDKSLPAGKKMTTLLQKAEEPAAQKIKLDKNELRILEHLQIHERITVKELAELINFSKRRAQRLLSTMVNKGLIRLFEHEREPYYAT